MSLSEVTAPSRTDAVVETKTIWKESAQNALSRIFKIRELHPFQRDVLEAVFAGSDVIVTAPTGSGKSLCFQLPAALSNGCTVVVSPLLALIRDQVTYLRKLGISAGFIDSLQSEREREEAILALQSNRYRLFYASPERLRDPALISIIKSQPVDRIVVDEAHCVSQWGFDFRPSFLQLHALREKLGNPQLLAFTATATQRIKDEVRTYLGLKKAVEFHEGIYRSNLRLEVVHCDSEQEKKLRLWSELSKAVSRGQSVIVYCGKTETVDVLREEAKSFGIASAAYHGKHLRKFRGENQDAFVQGRVPVMFATNAFGMGIHKDKVDLVLHYTIPQSLEAYYQEAGRAGRNGDPARCIILEYWGDRSLQKYFFSLNNPAVKDVYWAYNILWSCVPESARDNKYPAVYLEGGDVQYRVGSDPATRGRFLAGVRALDRNGIIEQLGPKAHFLVRSQDIGKGGLKIDEESHTKKASCDSSRLGDVENYLKQQSSAARWRYLERYFAKLDDSNVSAAKTQLQLSPLHLALVNLVVTTDLYRRQIIDQASSNEKKYSRREMQNALTQLIDEEVLLAANPRSDNYSVISLAKCSYGPLIFTKTQNPSNKLLLDAPLSIISRSALLATFEHFVAAHVGLLAQQKFEEVAMKMDFLSAEVTFAEKKFSGRELVRHILRIGKNRIVTIEELSTVLSLLYKGHSKK